MDFHFEVLDKETKNNLKILSRASFIGDGNFYLAGGTGLALQIGHRRSYDLDFFAQKEFDESRLIQQISLLGNFQLEKKAPQSVIGALNNTKVSFLGYRYPLLLPLREALNINVADILDIACMKIDAIASRGTKRDFIDIYFVVKELLPLKEIFKKFSEKYASLRYNLIHIKKSLVYFTDAENDPSPSMLKPVDWLEVKKFFEKEVVSIE
jgi:hypothetical protein